MRDLPELKTDHDVEALLDKDLSDLDFKQFKAAHFTIAEQTAAQRLIRAGGKFPTLQTVPRRRF